MNTDGSHYTSEAYSDLFELAGANGTWPDWQRQVNALWGADGMSCTGWACVKECAESAGANATTITWPKYYRSCINVCPGVDVHYKPSHGGVDDGPLVEPPACPTLPSESPMPTGPAPISPQDLSYRVNVRPPSDWRSTVYTGAAVSRRRSTIFVSSLYVPLVVAMAVG